MKYTKQISVNGNWAKGAELVSGSKAKIVSETNPMPSSFKNKDGSPKVQDVCKIQFEGLPEPLNVSLNRATINGLVDAFGEDSMDWQNHSLTVETEKMRVAGKAVVAVYLIPEEFKKIDDQNGFVIIVREGVDEEKVVALEDESPF